MNYFKLGLVPVLTTLLLVGCGGEDSDVDAQKIANEAYTASCKKDGLTQQECSKQINKVAVGYDQHIITEAADSVVIDSVNCEDSSIPDSTSCDVAAFNILDDPNHSSGKGALTLDQDANMALWSSEGSSNANYTYALNMIANHSNNDQGAITYNVKLLRDKLSDETAYEKASFSMPLNDDLDQADFVILDMFNHFGLIGSLFESSETNKIKDMIEVDNSSLGNKIVTSKLILSAGQRLITAYDADTLVEVAKYKFVFYPDFNHSDENADGVVSGDVELRPGVGIVRIQFSVKNSRFYDFKTHTKQGEKYDLYAKSKITSLSW